MLGGVRSRVDCNKLCAIFLSFSFSLGVQECHALSKPTAPSENLFSSEPSCEFIMQRDRSATSIGLRVNQNLELSALTVTPMGQIHNSMRTQLLLEAVGVTVITHENTHAQTTHTPCFPLRNSKTDTLSCTPLFLMVKFCQKGACFVWVILVFLQLSHLCMMAMLLAARDTMTAHMSTKTACRTSSGRCVSRRRRKKRATTASSPR